MQKRCACVSYAGASLFVHADRKVMCRSDFWPDCCTAIRQFRLIFRHGVRQLVPVDHSFSSSVRSGSGIIRSSVSGSLICNYSHARCASINVLIACSVARYSVRYIIAAAGLDTALAAVAEYALDLCEQVLIDGIGFHHCASCASGDRRSSPVCKITDFRSVSSYRTEGCAF